MFPSSASSSSQGSMASSGRGGVMRYGSAPSSVISAAADSVIGPGRESESTAMANHNDAVSRRNREEHTNTNTTIGLQTSSSRFAGGGGGSSLLRHSSSPAGFLNQLAAAAGDVNGFSITRGIGSYNSKGVAEQSGGGIPRLNSQHREALSRISEEAEDQMAVGQKSSYSAATTGSFGMGSWEHTSNPIIFSVAPPNRPKNNVDPLDNMESQFQFSISQTAQDMASMEKMLNIPQDSVTCKIRAKRGCATHPRSIAERERRTRISGKLKKLQDLVPNMDKQTSYSDMLDLAVQHIKTLQNQVQKLNKEMENCKCGCNKSGGS